MKKTYKPTAFKCPHCAAEFCKNVYLHPHKKTKCPTCYQKFRQQTNKLTGVAALEALSRYENRDAERAALLEKVPLELMASTIKGSQIPNSLSEARFKSKAFARGWKPHRPSWPDFLVQTDGELIAVEVKSGSDRISLEQQATFDLLEQMGIKIFIWKDTKTKADMLLRWRNYL